MIAPTVLSRRIRALPTLSSALVELDRVLAKPNASVDDVERVLRVDPALTTNLLRVANSGLHGLRRRIETVRQAILLIGLRGVRELAVSSAFAAIVPARLPGYEMDAQGYWSHSAAVAVLASELAAKTGADSQEKAFVAGLLHDIGKLALASFLAESGPEVFRSLHQERLTFLAAERALLGTDHAQVGAELANYWKLPTALSHVALWHHEPSVAQGHEEGRLVDLVHVADALAHLLGCGWDVGELAREPHPLSLQRLGLRPKELEATASRAWERIAEARRVVGNPEES